MKQRSFHGTSTSPDRAYLRAMSSSQAAGGKRPPAPAASRGSKKNKLKFVNVGLGIDMPFLILVLVLLGIGILMMFSASYPVAYAEEGDSYFYLKKQLFFALFGVAAMIGLSFVNYHVYYKAAKIILGISFVILVIVRFMPSDTGVHRWIYLGPFTFQASEVSKFCVIVFLAFIGAKNANKIQYIRHGFGAGFAVLVVTAVLLLLEPHYSCIVIMFLIVLVMMYLSGVPGKQIGVFIGVIGVLIIIAWSTGILGYAMKRLDGWGLALEYIDEATWQATWQTRNSMYAIGSGGLWGLGLGNSRQKYLYLPEPQNDFVFAVVCEELGFIGAIAILILFGLLVWRGIYLAQRSQDIFGKLLGCGLSAQIGLQVILNILVITDWLPNTGISLPFFSYGGTSLVMLLAQMGVVLSVSRTSRMEKT